MNGREISDEQLVAAFRAGDGSACEELLIRYKNSVLAVARRFFLVGGDTEDLVQEGMCGLYSAILSFKGVAGFSAYAHACIKNRIVDAVKKSINAKNLPPCGILPFTEDGEGDAYKGFTPEDEIIDSEAERELAESIKKKLSPLEYNVIKLYIDGATISEISTALNLTYKQTDNALVRSKNKLRGIIIG